MRIVGVMGGGDASHTDSETAYRLGKLIAQRGWVLLNGGRNCGIMEASAKGAMENGGLTVGVLPDDHGKKASKFIALPIITGMGSARNCINVLTSDVIIACRGGPGTFSEIALALKYGKKVILMNHTLGDIFGSYRIQGNLMDADSPENAVEIVDKIFKGDF